MEVPMWFVAVVGTLATCLIGMLGFLLKSTLVSMQKQGADNELAVGKIRKELAAVDKRFIEEQLAQSKQFVDKEGFTRDYVTLTQRLDGLHKRVDRVERDSVSPRRLRQRPDTDPPR